VPRKILIRTKTKSLGDLIGASPYFELFRVNSEAEVYVSCQHHELFQPVYPKIHFLPHGFLNTTLFDQHFDLDFLFDVPLQQGFCQQLGLDYIELRPSLQISSAPRPLSESYVCLGVQSTAQCKYWNYPGGWQEIALRLRDSGLVPVCIDQHQVFGVEGHFNSMPGACLDRTGLTLPEVITFLTHCQFFVGLSSGLSWVAHALQKHVVMISGATHKWCEFTTDVTRIGNESVCHGCFNEPDQSPFNPGDWLWCPRLGDTPSRFECSKTITPDQVWRSISKIIASHGSQ